MDRIPLMLYGKQGVIDSHDNCYYYYYYYPHH
jgi:hypothetical protein